jgi:chromosome segregation ATPase
VDTAHIDQLLADVRRRRSELRRSMARLEQAIAAPARPGWSANVAEAVAELADDMVEHIAATESADGAYEQILKDAPRLAGAIRRLTEEHGHLTVAIRHLAGACGAAEPDVGRIREEATALLAQLTHHRQRGSDLLYEAYQSDIGGET